MISLTITQVALPLYVAIAYRPRSARGTSAYGSYVRGDAEGMVRRGRREREE